jgi:hypothetical protein
MGTFPTVRRADPGLTLSCKLAGPGSGFWVGILVHLKNDQAILRSAPAEIVTHQPSGMTVDLRGVRPGEFKDIHPEPGTRHGVGRG